MADKVKVVKCKGKKHKTMKPKTTSVEAKEGLR
jgi:hypothetical protein